MIDAPREPQPETPRSEPEIIPPTRAGGHPQPAGWAQNQWQSERLRHIKITRIGPFKLALWAFAALLFIALLLFVFAGALLIAMPIVAAVIAGSLAMAWFRRTFRR